MKKALLALGLLAGTAGAARAQQPTNTIGLAAGYARTTLSGGGEAYSATSHSAYQAGLTADVYLSEVVSFHPEVLYTMRYFDATVTP